MERISASYADVTQEVAQKASCLAPKTFSSTLRTVKTALLASNKTPNGSPSKANNDTDPMAYATLIGEYKIGQPRRVEKWMKEAQAALVALPRFRHDFASLITESGTEVRIVVFFWVCRAIKVRTRLKPRANVSHIYTHCTSPALISSQLYSKSRWPTSMASRSRFSIAFTR